MSFCKATGLGITVTAALGLRPPLMPSIQGLRGLAATSVLIVHLYLMARNAGFWPIGMDPVLTLVWSSMGHGVEIFFLISGYLIPASLLRRRSITEFMLERVLRIMPLFLILHFVVFGFGPVFAYKFMAGIGIEEYAVAFLTNLTFTAPFFGIPLAQQNSWTLTYEWLFYGILALAFAARRLHFLNAVSAVLLIAGVVFPLLFYFFAGMQMKRNDLKIKLQRGWGAFIAFACLILTYLLAQFVSTLSALPFAVVFFGIALDQDSVVGRILSTRIFQKLGLISYSLYLLHPFVLFPLQKAFGGLVPLGLEAGVALILFIVLGSVGTLIASSISFRLVEIGLTDWLRGQVETWRSRTTPLQRRA